MVVKWPNSKVVIFFIGQSLQYVPVAMPGMKNFCFRKKNCFQRETSILREVFFKLGMMFSAYNKINLFAVSLPDQPYVLLGSVAHYFYEFSQLNRSYLVTLKLELEDNDEKRKETW